MKLVLVLAAVTLVGCGGGSHTPKADTYTLESIRHGFVTTGDLGAGAIQVDDSGHGSHVIYTPPDSIPTCPYVQRADNVTGSVEPAVELPGGNSTSRVVVGPRDPAQTPLPTVTQGARVFQTGALADQGMSTVQAAAAKCPDSFTVLGGPPVIVGDYKVTRRAFDLEGWTGFAQQLVHTFSQDVDPETYDDLVTVVVHRANAILYIGFEQTKKTGERADSASKVEAMMRTTLNRLG